MLQLGGVFALMLSFMGCDGGGSSQSLQNRLVKAARNDDVIALGKLLAKGANIDGVEDVMLSETALVTSASSKGTNAFYFLLSKGADVNAVTSDGTTALMQALTLGDNNLGRIRELIRLGANVNAFDKSKNSVLRTARAAGCRVAVDELIAAGARD